MKVLLSALVAVMLVSPALANDDTKSPCYTADAVLAAAPPGAKLLRALSPEEVKNFVAHAKIGDDIDGINLYSTPTSGPLGKFVFFTFKKGCTVGAGSGDLDNIEALVASDGEKI